MAISATFSPASGLLTAIGTSGKDTIKFSRDAAGNILTDDGTVTVLGGTPTVANTNLIQAFGQAGDDTITRGRNQRRTPRRTTLRWRRQRHDHRRFGQRPAVRSERQRHAAWQGRQ